VAAIAGPRLWPVLIPAAVLALGLGGLPLTGGMLVKLAVKAHFGDGVVGVLATLSAAGSTLLMIQFWRRLVQTSPRKAEAAPPLAGFIWPWLIMAFAGVIVPWTLYLTERIPEGDIVVVGEAATGATAPCGETIERVDGYLRQWPVASLSLLTVVIILGAAMLAWG